MSGLAKVQLVVVGRVQGVFYRQATREQAVVLGLSGWVRNESDGTVAVEVSGPRHNVEKLIAWCRKGPPHAEVDEVKVSWLELSVTAVVESSRFEVLG